MAFIPSVPFPAEPTPQLSDTLPDATLDVPQSPQNPELAKILDLPQIGEYKREMLTWRTPHLGYVKMYINPQELNIKEEKIINADRTKGGYVIQYAGEALIEISISGTTGSGGVEAINILRSVYRSEQEAFEGIAVGLDEALANIQLNTIGNNLLDQSPLADFNIFQIANDVFRNFGRPQPTLASLASNIELNFQGEVYRGFFKNFNVRENAASPGWFDYSMLFMAYARQGRRHNFMPWHRQPINPADVKSNPLSFTGAADVQNPFLRPPTTQQNPSLSVPIDLSSRTTDQIRTTGRFTNTAVGERGRNVRGGSLGG